MLENYDNHYFSIQYSFGILNVMAQNVFFFNISWLKNVMAVFRKFWCKNFIKTLVTFFSIENSVQVLNQYKFYLFLLKLVLWQVLNQYKFSVRLFSRLLKTAYRFLFFENEQYEILIWQENVYLLPVPNEEKPPGFIVNYQI